MAVKPWNLIEVISNQFIFQMTDNLENQINEYHILLEKYDLTNFNKIIDKYEINYLIKQDIPQLDLKWYVWNYEKNPNKKALITLILENGQSNTNYDSEVNAKIETKRQIMWIKHQTLNSFTLDLLNFINNSNQELKSKIDNLELQKNKEAENFTPPSP